VPLVLRSDFSEAASDPPAVEEPERAMSSSAHCRVVTWGVSQLEWWHTSKLVTVSRCMNSTQMLVLVTATMFVVKSLCRAA
jgi:hypothetical protein